jgi:retinol dehydrogenase 12
MAQGERRLAGKVALVTGATTGIGQVTARELARAGARVYIACRSREQGEAARARIAQDASGDVHLLSLDLGDLASVRGCAASFLARGEPLHILVNNAGVAGAHGLTRSGFELAFGVNHVGHFLLTRLLLGRLKESGQARVVHVASKAHYLVSELPWAALRSPTRTLTAFQEYATSKLANVLFNAELARRLTGTGVTSLAVHPGVIASDVWRSVPQPFRVLIRLGMKTVEEGADNSIYCATAEGLAQHSGRYFHEREVTTPSPLAEDAGLARELWTRSEQWVSG